MTRKPRKSQPKRHLPAESQAEAESKRSGPDGAPLVMPDLGLGEIPLRVSQWLTRIGQETIEGDRLLEIVAGEVSIDLPAPRSGTLLRRLVEVDQPIRPGQLLGTITEHAQD